MMWAWIVTASSSRMVTGLSIGILIIANSLTAYPELSYDTYILYNTCTWTLQSLPF